MKLWISCILTLVLIYFFNLERLTPPLNIYSELERMLALRKLGASILELSQEFAVPKSTIRYLIRRFGLAGKYKPPIRGKARKSTPSKYETLLYVKETINPGKTYAQYLQEDRERRLRKNVLLRNQRPESNPDLVGDFKR